MQASQREDCGELEVQHRDMQRLMSRGVHRVRLRG